MGAVATAWLATSHQQLMYLLSPEGKTVFYIPGVEVVHKVSTPINLPDEASKMEPGKMQPPPGGSRKRAAGLSLDLNSASAKRNKQVQKEKAGADFSVGRPGVGFEKRKRRPGGRREEDEGRGGPAEAGGDRARQLRM